MNKLSIEIETDQEQDLYKLFLHVFREITELDYRDDRFEARAKSDGNWLVFPAGKYRWFKDVQDEGEGIW